MLLLLLTVALLMFGTVTAVAAIGGETWRMEDRGFFQRITTRGWISLVCAVLTLAAGIAKEVLTQQESRDQQRKNDQLQGTINSQVAQIGQLQTDLKEANEIAEDTRTKLIQAQRASQKTTDAIQAYVFNALSNSNLKYLTVLGRMMGEATDGWLPQTETEFFSGRAINLLCSKLNIEGEAPVLPKLQWYRYFQRETKEYEETIARLLSNHGAQMSPGLIRSTSAVLTSFLLSYTNNRIAIMESNRLVRESDRPHDFAFPPVLCLGRVIVKEIEKSFSTITTLLAEVALGEAQFSLTPRMKDKQYLQVLKGGTFRRGGNRFDEAQWNEKLKNRLAPRGSSVQPEKK